MAFYENEPIDKKRARLLATGRGVDNMMKVSYERHYSNENSILHVKDPNDLNSKWEIWERLKN